MRIPARVARSRHGVYYFRIHYTEHGRRKERRVSLNTKDPAVARVKVIELSAIMQKSRLPLPALMPFDLTQFDPKDPATWPETHAAEQTHAVRKMDVVWSASGPTFLNVNSGKDVDLMVDLLRKLNMSYQEFNGLSTTQVANVLAGREKDAPRPTPGGSASASVSPSGSVPAQQEGGILVDEVIQRFATRKKDKLAAKTLYEYGNYHRIFLEWLQARERREHIPIRTVGRQHIADFIDDLKAENLSDRTIQQKYLAAVGGLFELAQAIGAYPHGELPSKGHKVFTKKDMKSAARSKSWRPFTQEELTTIFQRSSLLAGERPADFWLPLLGLYTGGRISELCQLEISDIKKYGDIWGISIDDEEEKQIKTDASERLIPLHPQLIELGFLHYLEDARQCGNMVFPYLTADAFGSYGGTPSERFGKYLDKLGITDRRKVFHSFRSTSNNMLKSNGVSEEDRCQFIGHEHDTTNSKVYSDPHQLPYLLKNVASKLVYSGIPFKELAYRPGEFLPWLQELCSAKEKRVSHQAKREQLGKSA